jgi:hypothetical protein
MKKPNLDRAAFLASKSIILNVAGQGIEAKPREFSTGSLGYYASGKVLCDVGGEVVTLQVSCNLPICGTKPAE